MVKAAMACVASRLGSACPAPFTFAKLLRTQCLVGIVLSGLNEHDNTFERYYHVHSLQTRQVTPRQQRQHKPSSTPLHPHPPHHAQQSPRAPPLKNEIRINVFRPKRLCVLFSNNCLTFIGYNSKQIITPII